MIANSLERPSNFNLALPASFNVAFTSNSIGSRPLAEDPGMTSDLEPVEKLMDASQKD